MADHSMFAYASSSFYITILLFASLVDLYAWLVVLLLGCVLGGFVCLFARLLACLVDFVWLLLLLFCFIYMI